MITDNIDDKIIERDRLNRSYSFEQTHCSENKIRELVLEFAHAPLRSKIREQEKQLKKEFDVSK